ncbi:MAG: hypothetical protein NE328_19180 [Lentisphaeraceae bacterium]|nr:hypothetical protein [Lentisphaeraceae bacterium]
MSLGQDKLTKGQELIENCINTVGSARKVSQMTGYSESTISRLRNGKRPISEKTHKLFWLALEVGYLKQENAHLKRKLGR